MAIPINFPFLACLSTALILILFASNVKSQVPTNQTFKIVNAGPLGEFENFVYTTEYSANYRVITNPVYDFYTFPFRLCFYNTTPNSFVLGIRAGTPDDGDQMRWVWDANRNRRVQDNAALSFGRDGNLVLSDFDGRLVWQTNTANKGVTGIKLLPNGNLVLFDKKGRFIWQSFDYPVDTLLVGMSVRRDAVSKLVSRTSDVDGSDGKYSLVLEDAGFVLYLNNSGQQVLYNGWPGNWGNSVRLNTTPSGWETPAVSWDIILEIFLASAPTPNADGFQNLREISFNATYSFLRMESDGNVKVYTYNDKVRFNRWIESFAFFSSYYVRECGLPSKCGAYGLCENGMCVGCPSPKGLLGWSQNCQPPKLKACRSSSSTKAKANYYKIAGAESFLNRVWTTDNQEVMKFEMCRNKCSNDCNCKGFIYKEDSSKCLVLPVVGTLVKFANSSAAYIKY